MESNMKTMKLGALLAALSTASAALAQTTGTLDLAGLFGGGAIGLVILAIVIFFGWRWFRGGSDD